MFIQNNIYTFNIFPSDVMHAISTRHVGSIKDKNGIHTEHLAVLSQRLGIDPLRVIFPKQIHGSTILTMVKPDASFIYEADGLISSQKQLFLGVITADCLPILVYDPKAHIVGAIHAGYKGLLAGVIEECMKQAKKMGSSPENMLVGIGPHIGGCCYDVPFERVEMFKKAFPNFVHIFEKRDNQYYLYLSDVASQILQQQRVKKDHIEQSGICTKHKKDIFYSFRGDEQGSSGHFASIIGIL